MAHRVPEGPLPEGLRYLPGFLSPGEEAALLERLGAERFGEVRMHGVVALPLRARAAELIAAAPDALEEVLLSEYPEGAGIGWHRDAPMFGPEVVGVSLLAPARMRFQRGKGEAREAASLVLEPRSAYVLAGPARSAWQHSIPGSAGVRYSITFRTLRRR